MEKKQPSPSSLSKCSWRFHVSQAPHDFGRVFNRCFGGGKQRTMTICAVPEQVQQMSTVLCHAKLGDTTFPSIQRASLAQGTGHGMAQQNWRSHPRFQGTGFPLCSGAQQMAAVWVPVPQQNLHTLHQAPSSKSKGTFVLQENTLQTTPNKLQLLEQPAQSTAASLSPVVTAGSVLKV